MTTITYSQLADGKATKEKVSFQVSLTRAVVEAGSAPQPGCHFPKVREKNLAVAEFARIRATRKCPNSGDIQLCGSLPGFLTARISKNHG